MIDLRFSYINKNNERVTECYSRIFDFTDSVESGISDASVLEGHDVEVVFFENSLFTKSFQTVKELYDHCVKIMK